MIVIKIQCPVCYGLGKISNRIGEITTCFHCRGEGECTPYATL
jgi:hypothetical protein